ncbi:MAG: hypothetical protein V3W45_06250 [Sedimentisphaerales bacterium]
MQRSASVALAALLPHGQDDHGTHRQDADATISIQATDYKPNAATIHAQAENTFAL